MNVAEIIVDMEYQMRATMSEEAIEQYAEEMADNKRFDPVTVVEVEGVGYVLAEGFHRVEATKRAGRTSIDANLFKGTLRDVKEHAYGANSAHGVRQTNADKRKKVMKALADPDFSGFQTKEYAVMCQVTERFINKIRHEMHQKPGTVPVLKNSLEVRTASNSPSTSKADGTGTSEEPVAGGTESAPEAPESVTTGGTLHPVEASGAGTDGEPSADELKEAEAYMAAARDNLALVLLDEDDPLKAVCEENLRLKEQVHGLESRLTGMMAERNELIKKIRRLERKAA